MIKRLDEMALLDNLSGGRGEILHSGIISNQIQYSRGF
jgi:hypothetical protein